MLVTILVVAVLAIGLALALCWPARSKAWLEKWPPISEDEFIRRCSPGVDRERALKVRRIIAEQLGVDYDRVYPEQRFVEDLGA